MLLEVVSRILCSMLQEASYHRNNKCSTHYHYYYYYYYNYHCYYNHAFVDKKGAVRPSLFHMQTCSFSTVKSESICYEKSFYSALKKHEESKIIKIEGDGGLAPTAHVWIKAALSLSTKGKLPAWSTSVSKRTKLLYSHHRHNHVPKVQALPALPPHGRH